jgi:hypothetical protein
VFEEWFKDCPLFVGQVSLVKFSCDGLHIGI